MTITRVVLLCVRLFFFSFQSNLLAKCRFCWKLSNIYEQTSSILGIPGRMFGWNKEMSEDSKPITCGFGISYHLLWLLLDTFLCLEVFEALYSAYNSACLLLLSFLSFLLDNPFMAGMTPLNAIVDQPELVLQLRSTIICPRIIVGIIECSATTWRGLGSW